jgi:hypothetical protein
MANIASTDVTVTINSPKDLTRRRRFHLVTIAFGDGAKTIPTGGLVPLPAKSLFGMATIDDMIILGGGAGYVVEYVPASHSLIIYTANYPAAAAGPLIAAAGVAIAATSIRAIVLGK